VGIIYITITICRIEKLPKDNQEKFVQKHFHHWEVTSKIIISHTFPLGLGRKTNLKTIFIAAFQKKSVAFSDRPSQTKQLVKKIGKNDDPTFPR